MKNTVKVERAIKSITQQDLAAAVGVSRQTINSIEAGGYVPSAVLALKIARYFGKPVPALKSLDESNCVVLPPGAETALGEMKHFPVNIGLAVKGTDYKNPQ